MVKTGRVIYTPRVSGTALLAISHPSTTFDLRPHPSEDRWRLLEKVGKVAPVL